MSSENQRPSAAIRTFVPAVGLIAGLFFLACASAPQSRTDRSSASRPPSRAGEPGRPLSAQLADGDFPTQRLFRFRYEGPEGSGSGRLTLRLQSPQRFEIAVADSFGRAVWTLGAEAELGLLVDHRQRTVCSLDSGVTLSRFLPGPVPLRAVPALLLGRLPVSGVSASSGEGRSRVTDDVGREWVVREAEDGTLAAWTMWVDGEPAAWWQRLAGGEMLLSERNKGVQLRWRQTLSEALTDSLPALRPPTDYRPGDCTAIDLSMADSEPLTPTGG